MRSLLLSSAAIISLALFSFAPAGVLKVSSTAFTDNGNIPVKYTCEGDEVSPPLRIERIPAGAASIAITVQDPDAPGPGGVTHWVLWNAGTDGNIPENYRQANQGMNSGEKNGYKGMCPPDGVHHFIFMVYALDTKLKLDDNTNKATLEKAMQGHILAQGKLTGLYRKIHEGEVK